LARSLLHFLLWGLGSLLQLLLQSCGDMSDGYVIQIGESSSGTCCILKRGRSPSYGTVIGLKLVLWVLAREKNLKGSICFY
jgi:hypothetical protein